MPPRVRLLGGRPFFGSSLSKQAWSKVAFASFLGAGFRLRFFFLTLFFLATDMSTSQAACT